MSAADLLEQAADYIEQHGWARGVLERGDGHVCAVGALRAVNSHGNAYAPLRTSGFEALDALEQHIGGSAPQWNDRQKDRRVVVRALRKAANSARLRESS